MVFAAAIALDHTGGLDPRVFGSAHFGVLLLIAVVGFAFAWRKFHRPSAGGTDQVVAFLAKSPWLVVFLVMSTSTVTVVRLTWGTRWLPSEIPAGLLLNDLYLLICGGLFLAVSVLVRLSRTLYQSATASRYRAGVATGVLVSLIAAFGPSGLRSGAETADAPVVERWASVARQTTLSAPSVLEGERLLLVAADQIVDPPPSPTPAATPAPAQAPVQATSPFLDDQAFSQCLMELGAHDERMVVDYVQRIFRIPREDALDLVRDTLVDVCVAHARKPYLRLGAVLMTAAQNSARSDWKRRSRFRCGITEEPASCTPAPDENVRFASEQQVLQRALCDEDEQHRAVIYLRLHEGLEFAPIGRELGIPEDHARAKYNNAIRRLKSRIQEACGG